MNEKNNGIFSEIAKRRLKKVKFLALGKQNTNTQPPKNNSYNGEIDEKSAEECLNEKPQTTYIIANGLEISKKLSEQAAKDKIIRDFENYGRE